MIVINNYCFYKPVNQALFVFLYSKIEIAEFIKCEKDVLVYAF